MILLADSEGPDQTVWMRMLNLVFAALIYYMLDDTFSHGAAHRQKKRWKDTVYKWVGFNPYHAE